MSIEFSCGECGKLLRVPETSAGKQARCPACGTIQKVVSSSKAATPQPMIEAVNSADALRDADAPAPRADSPFAATAPSKNPFADGASTESNNPFASNITNPYAAPAGGAGGIARITLGPNAEAWARTCVAGPANSLVAVAAIVLVLSAIGLTINLFEFVEARMSADLVFVIIGTLAMMVPYGIVIYGATQMKQLRNYNLAVTASILAMLPCSGCCILGLPVGIWSLVVLCNPTIRASFR